MTFTRGIKWKCGSMIDTIKFKGMYQVQNNSCWAWCRCTSDGYGRIWYRGRSERSHRVSWMIHKGSIPEGLCVLHRCNNRLCVNPEHLCLGTRDDNTCDAIAAGTYQGQCHHNAKLDNEDVICIKKMLRDGIKQWLIAWIYQVSGSAISHISTGARWSHIKI